MLDAPRRSKANTLPQVWGWREDRRLRGVLNDRGVPVYRKLAALSDEFHVTERALTARLHLLRAGHVEVPQVAVPLQELLARLPKSQADLCRLLVASGPMNGPEAARRLRVTTSSVTQALHRIRDNLTGSGWEIAHVGHHRGGGYLLQKTGGGA